LGGAQKFAHPVPFRNNKTGHRECILIIDWKGLVHLMKETGGVVDVEAHVVYSNDEFQIQRGTHKALLHSPVKSGDRGHKIGAYAIAYLEKGDPHFEYMTADEIEAIRKRAKAGESGPWKTDEDEMWRKTVTRRLSKYMISSISGTANRKLAKALAIEDRTIMEGDGNIVDLLDTETIIKEAKRQPVKQPQRASEVKQTSTAPTQTEAQNEDLKTRIQKRIAKLVTLGAGDPDEVLFEFSKFEKSDKKTGKKNGQFMSAESIEYLVARPKWAENVIRSMDKAIKDLEGPPAAEPREPGQEG
jgi:recombinational DNA repair protein RecT